MDSLPDEVRLRETDDGRWYELRFESHHRAKLVRSADNIEVHEQDDGRMKTVRLPMSTPADALEQASRHALDIEPHTCSHENVDCMPDDLCNKCKVENVLERK